MNKTKESILEELVKRVEFELSLLLAEFKEQNDDSRIANVLEKVEEIAKEYSDWKIKECLGGEMQNQYQIKEDEPIESEAFRAGSNARRRIV